jgi:hypothetical protein
VQPWQLRFITICGKWLPLRLQPIRNFKLKLSTLSFERATCAQKIGFKSREAFHHTNWDEAAKNPRGIAKFTGKWLLHHDPELYAYENYEACAAHLLHQKPFTHTNTVPGFPFKPWSVEELLEKSSKGESIEDAEGQWY